VEDLSNWYVRRNRRRFWKAEDDADKQAAYATLYTCLTTVARLTAPFIPFVSEALYRNLVATQVPGSPESVHLADWPVANAALIDATLLADTRLLLDVVNLGRAARRGAGLRVRQPLPELLVRAAQGGGGLHRFEDELRDELNVKTVRFLGVDDGLVEYHFKPNLPVVGKKYGRRVPAIKTALAALEGEAAGAAARAVAAGQPVRVAVEGETLDLAPNEVLVEAGSPQGYAVVEEPGLLVALNTTLTPELRREGEARDLVRYIQDARKAAGLDITDRIAVTLEPAADLDLEPVLAAHGAYIRAETLADSLVLGPPPASAQTAVADLDEGTVTIGVKRTAAD
jgi:isoleucyl-tRNA synthetase